MLSERQAEYSAKERHAGGRPDLAEVLRRVPIARGEVSTEKTTEEPAWLQNLEDTTERAGRAQDKEDLMERLRDLGYM